MAKKEKGKLKKHKPPCLLATPHRGNPMRPCTCGKSAAKKA
jgi:hypothetical protein